MSSGNLSIDIDAVPERISEQKREILYDETIKALESLTQTRRALFSELTNLPILWGVIDAITKTIIQQSNQPLIEGTPHYVAMVAVFMAVVPLWNKQKKEEKSYIHHRHVQKILKDVPDSEVVNEVLRRASVGYEKNQRIESSQMHKEILFAAQWNI